MQTIEPKLDSFQFIQDKYQNTAQYFGISLPVIDVDLDI